MPKNQVELLSSLEIEMAELQTKFLKLQKFIDSTEPDPIVDELEKSMLIKQYNSMYAYLIKQYNSMYAYLEALNARYKLAKEKASPLAYHYKINEVMPYNLANKQIINADHLINGVFVDGAKYTPKDYPAYVLESSCFWYVSDTCIENPSGIAANIVLAICKDTHEPVMINIDHVNARYFWWCSQLTRN